MCITLPCSCPVPRTVEGEGNELWFFVHTAASCGDRSGQRETTLAGTGARLSFLCGFEFQKSTSLRNHQLPHFKTERLNFWIYSLSKKDQNNYTNTFAIFYLRMVHIDSFLEIKKPTKNLSTSPKPDQVFKGFYTLFYLKSNS